MPDRVVEPSTLNLITSHFIALLFIENLSTKCKGGIGSEERDIVVPL